MKKKYEMRDEILSLDKWLKPEKKKEEPKKKVVEKKKPPIKKEIEVSKPTKPKSKKVADTKSITITKYVLVCPKAKCNFQRTLMKKVLTEKDQICPRCKGQMKIK